MFKDFRFYRELEKEKIRNPDYEGQIRDLRQAKWSSFRREVRTPLYILGSALVLSGVLYADGESQAVQEMNECVNEARFEKSPLECVPGLINFSRL